MRDGFPRAPTCGFGRIGVALCPSATASKALARATWAAGSACERLMRTSQSRSWSVSFRRGSFWRRVIGKPPGRVGSLVAYTTLAGISIPMTTDPLVTKETRGVLFDDLAQGLAAGTVSRRKALRLMGAALVGSTLASVPGVAWAAKGGNSACAKYCKT